MKATFIAIDDPRARSPTIVTTFPVILTRSSRGCGPPAAGVVSPLHCEIDNRGGVLVVRDLNSRHGVFVNGIRVRRAYLWPGDKLTVGLASFVVQYRWPGAIPWETDGPPPSSPEAGTPTVVIAEFSHHAGPCAQKS